MKKLLALVLTVCIMVTSLATVSFAAEFPDVPSSASYYPAVSLLSSLGIIKGYEDGTFGPDRNVTRAEFSVMLMRAMGMSGIASNDMNNMPFTDVESVVSWAGGDIKTAYSLGIINGMDAVTFAPEEQVTYEQALKMVVCALGYYQAALDAVGGDEAAIWPDGYLAVASQLKLNSGIGGSGANPAKRWEIAKIIYNALEIDLIDKVTLADGTVGYKLTEKNLLNDNLKVYYSTGDILSNEKETITTDKLSRAGEALIRDSKDGEKYIVKTGNISTDGLVGYTVKYYYTEDYNYTRTLVHIENRTGEDATLKLNATDIDSVTGTLSSGFEIDYWAEPTDRMPTTIETTANPLVSINGRAVDSVTKEDLLPESGEVTLIDSDNDGEFEKISIVSYVTYAVASVNTTEGLISDVYRTSAQGKNYQVDLNNSQVIVNITDESGTSMGFSNINKWSVVSVKESLSSTSKSIIDIVVSKQSVTGSITSLSFDEDEVEINNKYYGVSKYYKTYAATEYATWDVGTSGKFYLDKDGNIAAFDANDSSADSTKYGYLIKAQVARNSENAEFYLVPNTTGSAAARFAGASKITVDGELMSDGDQIVAAMYDNMAEYEGVVNVDGYDVEEDNVCTQVVKYTLNKNGEINMIDTVAGSGDLKVFEDNTDGTWKFNSATFTENSTKDKIKVDNSTFIIFVPEEGRTKYDDYSVKKYSASLFKASTSYTIEAYDVTGAANTAKVLVVYNGDDTAVISRETGAFLVTDVVSAYNNDSLPAYKVTGYLSSATSKGVETTFFTEGESLPEGFEVGNVVRFATNSKGYIKDSEVQVLVDLTQDGIKPFTSDEDNDSIDPTFLDKSSSKYSSTNDTYYYRVARGLLYMGIEDDTGDYGYIVPTGTRTQEAVEEAEDDVWMFTINSSYAKFFTYDASEAEDYRVTAHSGTMPLSGYSYYNDTEGGSDESAELAQEIFVYEANGQVRMIYIIRR